MIDVQHVQSVRGIIPTLTHIDERLYPLPSLTPGHFMLKTPTFPMEKFAQSLKVPELNKGISQITTMRIGTYVIICLFCYDGSMNLNVWLFFSGDPCSGIFFGGRGNEQ